MKNRFNIDFFEFCFLVEACIPPRPIARASFWNDVIDNHYHVLTVNERERLFDWINRCSGMEYSLEKQNEDCLLFNARFDPENQYKVKVHFHGEEAERDCFLWKGKYHISKNTFVDDKYILDIKKTNL